jgi:hypothetical protein
VKVVAFLQNQWFKEPERVREIYAKRPALREELNKRFLFAGCLTGRRLRKAFGELCGSIVWEEVSREVAGESSGCFDPDPSHIGAVINKHKPDIILIFGKVALEGVSLAPEACGIELITCPHPASRQKDVVEQLQRGADELREALSRIP